MRLMSAAALIFEAFQEWVRDRCGGLAAALAFNAILAIAPFLALVLILAIKAFGEPWARAHVLPAVVSWVGPSAAAAVRLLLQQNQQISPSTLTSLTILGAIGLLLGAVGFFLQMQDSLETIWDVRREVAGLKVQAKKRFRALLYAALSAVFALLGFAAAGLLPAAHMPHWVRMGGEAIIAFCTFWILTSFWFRVLPPVRLNWRQILPWSALIAALHLAGKLAVGGRVAAPSGLEDVQLAQELMLLLLWYYYATAVFLYGAELMRVYLQRQGAPAKAADAPG